MKTEPDEYYVSEFTAFMDHYLAQHPEVIEEQRNGWDIYWNPLMDSAVPNEADANPAPDDAYGFAWCSWRDDAYAAGHDGRHLFH